MTQKPVSSAPKGNEITATGGHVYSSVQCRILHSSQDVEITKGPIRGQMSKDTMKNAM